MMRILLLLVFLIPASAAFGQKPVEKRIEVGSYIKLGRCRGKAAAFESMDLYTKTRFPKSAIKIDALTGEGIFEHFFSPGDFDARRLPCSYGNKRYRIAALRTFEPKDSLSHEQQVIILYTKNKYSVIWVQVDKAIELNEVEF